MVWHDKEHAGSYVDVGDRLVDGLNELIHNLNIQLPFMLETPFDLTPGLLLGILESILELRLPISPAVRASRDFKNKVQAMKIFLGVFEHDILGGEDVGLSGVDPRRLAAGEEEEVEFVGELLCWLGRQRGFLAGPSRENDALPTLPSHTHASYRRASSPSTQSTVTSGTHSNLSMMPTILAESDTTVMSVASEALAPLAHPELPELPSFPPPAAPRSERTLSGSASRRAQPRCIHEVEDPSFALDLVAELAADVSVESSGSVCHCASVAGDEDLPPTPTTPLPHRYDGWIDEADERTELQFYYQRRSPPSASMPSSAGRRASSYPGLSSASRVQSGHSLGSGGLRRILTPHTAPTEYTLALMNERARLLDELTRIKPGVSAVP
ncbi:hypothetical protein C8Q80DRAFT_1143701 [Daedaleopsis nitida]|nr:hypothetical protein C8Q80DRAFT_1143701 [Daedaleopsis nitida]